MNALSNDVRALQLPLSKDDVLSLQAGDMVTLTGDIVVSIGLPTHQRMLDYLAEGKPLPVDLKGGTFLHLSSYNRESAAVVDETEHFEVLYLNPSTSTRYNVYMPGLIRGYDLRIVGGKGGLDDASVAAMRDTGCIYLSFLGGGCTLLSQALRGVVASYWNDYISQYRLVVLRVENLGPATVAIDAHGHSLYTDLREQALERVPELMDELNRTRGKTID